MRNATDEFQRRSGFDPVGTPGAGADTRPTGRDRAQPMLLWEDGRRRGRRVLPLRDELERAAADAFALVEGFDGEAVRGPSQDDWGDTVGDPTDPSLRDPDGRDHRQLPVGMGESAAAGQPAG